MGRREGARAAHRDHIARDLAGQADGHAVHQGGAVVGLADAAGCCRQRHGADLLGTDNDQLVAKVATGATGDGATKLVAANLQEAGRAIGCA